MIGSETKMPGLSGLKKPEYHEDLKSRCLRQPNLKPMEGTRTQCKIWLNFSLKPTFENDLHVKSPFPALQ